MNLGLTGRVAMVAAGTKGIGSAVAEMLAAEGCAVSVSSRSQENVSMAVSRLGPACRGCKADVTNETDLQRWYAETVNELGAPHILVTNTGGPPAGALESITDEQWREGFESTVLNVVRLSRLVSADMKGRGWGRIVHVTSLVAKEPNPLLPISSTLRAGLMAFVRLQALELAPHGVTVNAVLPGHTLTDRQRHLASVIAERDGIGEEEALERTASKVPMKRLATPEEIAAAVVFLCSEKASYVTGTNLLVDGGMVSGLG